MRGKGTSRASFSFGSRFSLHDLADHFEAGAHFFLTYTAFLACVGVSQTSQDCIQADARWRVVAQLVAQLTANAVANACFVGGQFEFGHATAPLEVKKGRQD